VNTLIDAEICTEKCTVSGLGRVSGGAMPHPGGDWSWCSGCSCASGIRRPGRPMMLCSVLLPDPDSPVSGVNSALDDVDRNAVQHLGFNLGAGVVAFVDAG
jgi:hypothetical protein